MDFCEKCHEELDRCCPKCEEWYCSTCDRTCPNKAIATCPPYRGPESEETEEEDADSV